MFTAKKYKESFFFLQDTYSESPRHHHYDKPPPPTQYVPVFALNALGKLQFSLLLAFYQSRPAIGGLYALT